MPPSVPVLELRGLTIHRSGTLILRDVHWRLNHGEHWVILGANGSGKTSLLQTLLAYMAPTKGSVSVLGSEFGTTPWHELRRHIGLVSNRLATQIPDEEPASTTVVSGRGAIIDYIEPVRNEDRAEALRLLRMVEAGPLADRPWGFLSQGERQRVLIARALMARPRILILDESCAGLDPVARETFVSFLERAAVGRQAPSMVFVTHHVEEIPRCITHALVLKGGRVLHAGAVRDVLTSETLSRAFGVPCRLVCRDGRFRLHLAGRARKAV